MSLASCYSFDRGTQHTASPVTSRLLLASLLVGGTLITADVYVESRLFAQRQLEVQSADQRVAVDFGSLPDGVHGLSVVLKSASTLPRFAPQTLRATLTATGC